MHEAFLTLGLTEQEETLVEQELVNQVLMLHVEEGLTICYNFLNDHKPLFNNCIVTSFTASQNATKILIQRIHIGL